MEVLPSISGKSNTTRMLLRSPGATPLHFFFMNLKTASRGFHSCAARGREWGCGCERGEGDYGQNEVEAFQIGITGRSC